MLIDLHMHESTFSSDSFLELGEMVRIAQERGLEGICVTDHDSMGLRERAESYSRRIGYPILVGVEFYSLQGDIVAFGIDGIPQRRIGAQDFVDYVHARGGICFSAHPFRSNNRGLDRNLAAIRGLDGIEAFNASTDYGANLRALDCCSRMGIQPLGVSDCHVPEKVGRFATRLPEDVATVEDLLHVFRMGRCTPVGYWQGKYIDLTTVAAPYECTVAPDIHDGISLQKPERVLAV